MEVIGYADAARWVYGQAIEPGDWTNGKLLSLQEVHRSTTPAMPPVWNVAPHPHATRPRNRATGDEHEIEPFPEGMNPPPFTDIDPLMPDWVDSSIIKLRKDSDVPFPERLATIHNAFERIHPFLDGNGRTGRLLLNLVLVRLGYPPAIIFKNERTKYLTAIRQGRQRRRRPAGGTHRPGRDQQPVPLRRARGRRARPAGTDWPAWRDEQDWTQCGRATHCGAPRTATRAEAARWHLDVLPQVGCGVPGQPLSAVAPVRT